jgi:hypothetical protein
MHKSYMHVSMLYMNPWWWVSSAQKFIGKVIMIGSSCTKAITSVLALGNSVHPLFEVMVFGYMFQYVIANCNCKVLTSCFTRNSAKTMAWHVSSPDRLLPLFGLQFWAFHCALWCDDVNYGYMISWWFSRSFSDTPPIFIYYWHCYMHC